MCLILSACCRRHQTSNIPDCLPFKIRKYNKIPYSGIIDNLAPCIQINWILLCWVKWKNFSIDASCFLKKRHPKTWLSTHIHALHTHAHTHFGASYRHLRQVTSCRVMRCNLCYTYICDMFFGTILTYL